MEARSTDKKTFQLTENGKQMGEISYENLFFFNAEINTNESKKYILKPVGFFGSSIAVTQNEAQIASLSLSWSGKIIITFQDGQEFILILNDLFSNKFFIENKDKEKLIQLEAEFDWKKFVYNYNITTNIAYEKTSKYPLLLLLGVYAANYYIATISGANTGMVF